MKYYIYRNHTIEHLFKGMEVLYSGYGDISKDPKSPDIENIIWFYQLSPFDSSAKVVIEFKNYIKKIEFLFDQDDFMNNTIIIIPDIKLINYLSESENVTAEYHSFFEYIKDLSNRKANVKYIFLSDFSDKYSLNQWIDFKFYYVSDMIINPKLSLDFSSWFISKLRSLSFVRKKCLVLDCDNTLWGGIIGEDGIDGIQLGNNYPGKAFLDFQKAIVELHNSGIIIALCSKNNKEDVIEVFKNNSNMILKMEHISAYRINWENKAQNIIQISKELNIGLDSIVFVDDNPLEREIVKKNTPEVIVPDFPTNNYDLLLYINSITKDFFSTFKLTAEDKQKAKQYAKLSQIQNLEKSYLNHNDYLKDLDMTLILNRAKPSTISRFSQMTQKTNQFNLTTKRYNESELSKLIEKNYILTTLQVRDKFGDHGITAAIIIKLDGSSAEIDSLLLSCRILGRGIENALLKLHLNLLFELGVKNVIARYFPTKKNIQTENFYDLNGFELIEVNENGDKKYLFNIKNKLKIEKYFKIEDNDK
jgi:FkbH-like protein